MFGACCKGRSERRILSYVVPALNRFASSAASIVTGLASLFPRWWPRLLDIDAFEETVLVRLGANELEATEYADEFVDAVDPCRSGLDGCDGISV